MIMLRAACAALVLTGAGCASMSPETARVTGQIAGGVAGAVAGAQLGGGTGSIIATGAGAIAGVLLGEALADQATEAQETTEEQKDVGAFE